MDKEQLINLINSLEIEEINSIVISYFSEKKEKDYSCYAENSYKERELRTLSYGNDISKRLDYLRNDMENMAERLHRENCILIEELIDKKLNK